MTNINTICDLAVPGVQQLVPYVPGKPIEELERELGLTRIVKLASNENPLGPGKKALAAIQATLSQLALYPDGNGFNLKQALARKYGVETGQITLGNGSNEILELVARAFLTTEHEVVFSQHAFAVYPIVTQAVGAKAVVVPAVNYGHDLEAMLQAVNEKTRLVFVANPNNPTGTWVDQSCLERFIKALPETCLCVLDEAYYEFVDSTDPVDSIGWLKKYPNLLITRTFSKAYGLAGLRVGYGLSSPELADILNRVRQPFNNNMLALAAAEAALSDAEHLERTITVNARGMQQLTDGFRKLGLEWIPSHGNFVSVDLKQPGLPVYEALLRKGVIVRPVANYEMPSHLRVSIGTEVENRIFLNALSDILSDV
ncbi:MAG: histidinol-phosphate transaminase [Methylobacter sp.]|uniref:histidinol-phosphate transaminase n=1 Tax=Methylobacter sp. TaxID=2051955 RepID=UPI0025881DF6|nr:histidinol-phosphate transaminase [Methylobacter sp.]MCL7421971.1 histidinol-phosphate transaminase [Methylobacter sp.]